MKCNIIIDDSVGGLYHAVIKLNIFTGLVIMLSDSKIGPSGKTRLKLANDTQMRLEVYTPHLCLCLNHLIAKLHLS